MIRRRRNVILAVLLFGLAWFVIIPLVSKIGNIDEAKQDVEHHHHPHHPISRSEDLKDLDSSHDRKRIAKNSQVYSFDAKDEKNDDLSEIEYPQAEMRTFQEHDDLRFFPVVTDFQPDAGFHRRRATPTRSDVENSEIKQSFRKINSPGHKGRMVRIDPKSLSATDRKFYDSGWEKYYHNEFVNNMISPQRVLPDVRDPACRSLQYSVDNFETSVVIVIHNEAWMSLIRTIHSVVDNSPENLLKEIILVDDASTFSHLTNQLTKYVSHISKIRLVRIRSRRGSSYARHLGASFATGDVIVFLDAHCECTNGWLEPLLSHVAQNSSNVAVPVVDLIDDDTFAYRAYDATHIRIGGFDWSLAFQWMEIPEYEKKRRISNIDPIRNPVMWGGIFAVSRDFYNDLNGYDQSLHMLGVGQNIEMSLKIWLCGGAIETIPCSHVGHLFHNQKTFGRTLFNNEALMNYAAVAHMWLDEYKDIHFQKMGFKSPPRFNNTDRHLAFRKRLHCHSFDWYLHHVYRELFAPSLAIASGRIKSKMRSNSKHEGRTSLCITIADVGFEKRVNISKCRSSDDRIKPWFLSRSGEIRQGDYCLDYPGGSILIYSCHGGKGNQEWAYRMDRTIQQVGTKLCLTLSPDGKSLTMAKCTGSDHQIWYWKRNPDDSAVETEKEVAVKQELAKVMY